MRIHSDIITRDHIHAALLAEKKAGRIGTSVVFDTLSAHNSRTHKHASEVRLIAYDAEDAPDTPNRRHVNSGGYGRGEDWAATYDEWGWLIAALYAIDPEAVWGTVRYPVYADAQHFHERTAYTYDPEELIDAIENYGGDPYPYVSGAGAKSKKGYQVGRRGYGRSDDRHVLTWGGVHKPRTVEEVRAYARLSDPAKAAQQNAVMRADIERAIRSGKLSPAARDMSPDDVLHQYTESNGLTIAEAVAEIIAGRNEEDN